MMYQVSPRIALRPTVPVFRDWISLNGTGPQASCGEASCPGEQTSRAQRGRTPGYVPVGQEPAG